MKTRGLCLFMLGLAAPMAQASIQLDNITCSSSLSLSDQNGISFACGGDLSLSGGSVSAEEGNLLISAVGALSLNNIRLNAANIGLSAESIHFGDLVAIFGESVEIGIAEDATGSVVLNTPLNMIPQGGRIDLSATSPLDITLRPGADISASRGDRLPIIASPIRPLTAGDVTLFHPGGDISITSGAGIRGVEPIRLQTGGEIVIQSGGALVIQGTPLIVPVPTAFSQLLLGLMAFITPAIRRKRQWRV